MGIFELLLMIFGVLATIFWAVQFLFAMLYLHKTKSLKDQTDITSVSVVLSVYNEPEDIFQKTVDSIMRQKNINIELIVVDDGSDIPVFFPGKLIRLANNCGKRYAQILGSKMAQYDWVVFADSDTILNDDAIYQLCKYATQEKSNAVGGNIELANENENIITQMTSCMYWFSFFQERASQSYFGVMTCCSGALCLYKKDLVLQNEKDYINQTFFGIPCQSGEDRHLTNICLLNGEKVVWCPDATAKTVSPSKLFDFLKQQLRWARSQIVSVFYTAWNWKRCRLMYAFMSAKLIYCNLYLLLVYFYMLLGLIHLEWMPMAAVFLTILAVTAVKSSIFFGYTKKNRFLDFFIYAVFNFCIMNPLLIYAMITPNQTAWMTRGRLLPQKT